MGGCSGMGVGELVRVGGVRGEGLMTLLECLCR